MNAGMYIEILSHTLVPFLERVYPDHHRFMQDNTPNTPHERPVNSLLLITLTGGGRPLKVQMQT